jgi:TRAP-type mannitol/chloroaromatic compound transport system substrate-binding protein
VINAAESAGRTTTCSWAFTTPHGTATTRLARARQAAASVQVSGFAVYQAKNGIALEKLKGEFKGKVEVIQLPVPVLRKLKKLSVEVIREQSEKTSMARKVHACFTRFRAVASLWDHVAEGAYRQLVTE